METKNIDMFVLFLRFELFLFGVVFTAIGGIIKGQFHMHGKINKLNGKCESRNCPAQEKAKKKEKA